MDDLIPGLRAPADPAAANGGPPAAAPTGVGAAFPTSGPSGAGSSTSAFSATGFAMPPGDGNPGLTRRADEDAFGAANHTLVVAPGAVTDYGRGRGRSGHGGPREPGLQRWLFSRRLYYVLGGLAAVLLIGLLIWWQSAGKYTTVPSVGGLAASTARLEVRSQGLTAKMGQPQFSARVAKGNIIATEPAIGSRVSKGGTVLLIVSAGPHMIPVPQVTGSTLATAQAALRHAGLIPGKVVERDVHHHRERDRDQHHAGVRRVVAAEPARLAGGQQRPAGAQLRRPAEGGGRAVGAGQRRQPERGRGREE